MIQPERRLYRRDTTRRLTPQDRPNVRTSLSGSLSVCGPCSDECLNFGTVTDCGHCPNFGAAEKYRFGFPRLQDLLAHVSPLANGSVLIAHAGDCVWESDDEEIVCDYVADEFGWQLDATDDDVMQTVLKLSRRAGGGCCDLQVVYRNPWPWQCLCPNMMWLMREETRCVFPTELPCAICVTPVSDPFECGSFSLPQSFYVDGGFTMPNFFGGADPNLFSDALAPPRTLSLSLLDNPFDCVAGQCQWWGKPGATENPLANQLLHFAALGLGANPGLDANGAPKLNATVAMTITEVAVVDIHLKACFYWDADDPGLTATGGTFTARDAASAAVAGALTVSAP